MSIEKKLFEEIEQRLEDLNGLPVGSEEYEAAVNAVTKLMDRAIEIDKFNTNTEAEAKNRKFEEELKTKEFEDNKKDRRVRNILTGAGIAVPSILTIWGTLKTLKFEETGTITTQAGRAFINKLFKK